VGRAGFKGAGKPQFSKPYDGKPATNGSPISIGYRFFGKPPCDVANRRAATGRRSLQAGFSSSAQKGCWSRRPANRSATGRWSSSKSSSITRWTSPRNMTSRRRSRSRSRLRGARSSSPTTAAASRRRRSTILSTTVRVSSREAYVSPNRGAQGNALKTIIAMPFALDGDAGVTVIEARGLAHRIRFTADPIRQIPVVTCNRSPSSEKRGTRITVRWPASACLRLFGRPTS
jgi:hypothetical protein